MMVCQMVLKILATLLKKIAFGMEAFVYFYSIAVVVSLDAFSPQQDLQALGSRVFREVRETGVASGSISRRLFVPPVCSSHSSSIKSLTVFLAFRKVPVCLSPAPPGSGSLPALKSGLGAGVQLGAAFLHQAFQAV